MKTQLSSIELKYITQELVHLEGSRLDQVYQPEKNVFIFQFYVVSKGKFMLNITLPSIAYLAESKGDVPERPTAFCTFLRTRLSNARITSIRQLDSERILLFQLEKKGEKTAKYDLYIELFSKGNIILCDEDDIIINVLYPQKFKERDIVIKAKYSYPKKSFDLFTIKKGDFTKLLKESNKESVVKMLAMDIGLSGIYAEELCDMAGIEKNKPKVDDSEISRLFSSLEEMLSKKPEPCIAMQNSSPIEALPFRFGVYSKYENNKEESFSSAIEFMLKNRKAEAPKKTKSTEAIGKLKRIMDAQQPKIEALERAIKEDQRKGEIIYEHYTEIKDMLDKLKIAREKMGWEGIKEKVKGNKLVKSINEKEGKITVDIK